MKKTLTTVAIWIIVINAFALFAWNRINVSRDTAYDWIDQHHLHTPSWNLLALPARWDSEWYFTIARTGYQFQPSTQLQNIVFFPIYPALIFVVGYLLFGNLILAGWLISLAALAGACVVFKQLLKEFHPKLDADDALFFLLVFPTAIFFNAVYTESLFLLLSVTTIYFARKKQFGLASIVGAAAALTRITGALLFIPLAIEYAVTYGWKKGVRPIVLSLLLIPLASASFFGFHWWKTGDPFFFFKVESAWGRSFKLNADHFATATSAALVNLMLDVGFLALALVLTWVVLKKIRASYAWYCLATILVAVSSGSLMSIGRYVLVLFPLSMALASLKPETKRAWSIVSIMLLALYTTLFAHSYWTG
ncbi:MAG TPA: hypothetical protein VN397_03230 [Candidatus Methylomirabilis sp.]|nr:hypothetical protein [Candidatus Methylomirabilis sp.]